MKKILLGAVAVILFCAGTLYIYQKTVTKNSVVQNIPAVDEVINAANFMCGNDKTIQAIFYKNRVNLILSDSRNLTLPQTISASGARYANSNESFVFWNKGTTAFITEGATTTFQDCSISAPTEPSNQLANPASINCLKLGGNLVMNKRNDGGEYGLCYFGDNRACEEWALLRGDCPYGGRKTTGFDTIDQNYCAWLGGDTFAVPNSICIFKNGSKCPTVDFYSGSCSPTTTN